MGGFDCIFILIKAAYSIVYQLLAHGRWFSPGTPASSTTKTGRHDIAEILLKVVLNTKNQSLTSHPVIYLHLSSNHHDTQINGHQAMRNYCELNEIMEKKNVESWTPHDRSGAVMPHDIVVVF